MEESWVGCVLPAAHKVDSHHSALSSVTQMLKTNHGALLFLKSMLKRSNSCMPSSTKPCNYFYMLAAYIISTSPGTSLTHQTMQHTHSSPFDNTSSVQAMEWAWPLLGGRGAAHSAILSSAPGPSALAACPQSMPHRRTQPTQHAPGLLPPRHRPPRRRETQGHLRT